MMNREVLHNFFHDRLSLSPALKALTFLLSALYLLLTISQAADVWVAPSGDDQNTGSFENPFRTLGHAVGRMKPGDRCILRGGTYREEIVVEKPNVSIVAQGGETVLLTGCDVFQGWQGHHLESNGVDCQRTMSSQRIYAAFQDGRPLPLARWPDKTASLLSLQDWAEGSLDGVERVAILPASIDSRMKIKEQQRGERGIRSRSP